jgi:hypothetical protein
VDEEDKVEGAFVAPQSKSSARGPWNLFSQTPPFVSYIDRIFRYTKIRREAEEAAYIGKLLNSKGAPDGLLFERAHEILREIRGVPRWITYCRKQEEALHRWWQNMKCRRWPEFRRKVGF